MSLLVAPSLLSADFARLGEEVELINNSAADWLHLDVMDGVFVPNISFGFPVIQAIKKLTTKPLDVHLMIVHPENFILEFKKAGADVLTVHVETCNHLNRTINQIKSLGMKSGVAINPHTPVSFLSDIIADVDLVCLMSVNPGFGGQVFIEHTYQKVRSLKLLIQSHKSSALIEVDGGVGLQNAKALAEAGADVLVAGNSVFADPNPASVISKLKAAGK